MRVLIVYLLLLVTYSCTDGGYISVQPDGDTTFTNPSLVLDFTRLERILFSENVTERTFTRLENDPFFKLNTAFISIDGDQITFNTVQLFVIVSEFQNYISTAIIMVAHNGTSIDLDDPTSLPGEMMYSVFPSIQSLEPGFEEYFQIVYVNNERTIYANSTTEVIDYQDNYYEVSFSNLSGEAFIYWLGSNRRIGTVLLSGYMKGRL